jgi:hypothetical protein
VDKERAYCDLAYDRIREVLEGTLKRRELGTPVYQPSLKDTIAKKPLDWEK